MNHVLIAFLASEVRRQNELLLEALYVPGEQRVLHRRADNLVAVADDIDAKRRRLAGLISPVRMVWCDRHGDTTEWLPRRLRLRDGREPEDGQ